MNHSKPSSALALQPASLNLTGHYCCGTAIYLAPLIVLGASQHQPEIDDADSRLESRAVLLYYPVRGTHPLFVNETPFTHKLGHDPKFSVRFSALGKEDDNEDT